MVHYQHNRNGVIMEKEQSKAEKAGVHASINKNSQVSATSRKKSKKRNLIAAVASIVVVLGVGAGAYAFIWYNSPEKIVMDAFSNAISADTAKFSGSMKVSDSETKVMFEGEGGYAQGIAGNLTADVATEDKSKVKFESQLVALPDGDAYAELKNLKGAYDIFLNEVSQVQQPTDPVAIQQRAALTNFFDSVLTPFVERIDGQWLKFSSGDVKKLNNTLGVQYECIQKTLQSLKADDGKLKELGQAYQNTRPLSVKERIGEKDGSVGYRVELDADLMREFSAELETTQLYKDLDKCSIGGLNPLDTTSLNESKTKLTNAEFWINKDTRQFTRIVFKVTDEMGEKNTSRTFDIAMKMNVPVTVSAPKESIPYIDVAPDFSSLFGAQFGTPVPPQA
jgi:hypothetical protein